jgi:hypothetical protein
MSHVTDHRPLSSAAPWVPPATGAAVYVVHTREEPLPDWVVGTDPYVASDFGGLSPEDVPEISVDPESGLLSLLNPGRAPKTYFLTVAHACAGGDGSFLRRDASCAPPSTTFVAVVEGCTVLDLCFVDTAEAAASGGLRLASDVRLLTLPPPADPLAALSPAAHGQPVVLPGFPLGGAGPYLCTQGAHGRLTHFMAETLHAVDFACPVGSPVLAVGDGVVTAVSQSNAAAAGVHCSSLFAWNSIMLRLDGGVHVEYVHIEAGSAAVAVGARVVRGQLLCRSGAVGFCPEPHLHVQAHLSAADSAMTIPLVFTALATGAAYVPVPGILYTAADGPVAA